MKKKDKLFIKEQLISMKAAIVVQDKRVDTLGRALIKFEQELAEIKRRIPITEEEKKFKYPHYFDKDAQNS